MDPAIVAALIQAAGLVAAAVILAVYGPKRMSVLPPPRERREAKTADVPPPLRRVASSLRSLRGDTPVTVVFRNDGGRAVRLYWLDYGGKPVLSATVSPGDTFGQNTFLTHPWLVTNEDDEALLLYFPDPHVPVVGIGE